MAVEDEGFDPRSIPLQRWDDYALANNLPGRRGHDDMIAGEEKFFQGGYTDDAAVEMDDMHSVYSSVKAASTILTGFPGQGRSAGPYVTPHSPAPFGGNIPGNRNSHFSSFTRYTDAPQLGGHAQPHMSMGNLSHYQDNNNLGNGSRLSMPMMTSSENLLGTRRQSSRSPLAAGISPSPPIDFRNDRNGPDDFAITDAIRSCLAEVDLDTVTKKQGM